MTAHWIEVKEQKWKMRAEVIAFKALSGAHSGENLGRYAVGLLDCGPCWHNGQKKIKGMPIYIVSHHHQSDYRFG